MNFDQVMVNYRYPYLLSALLRTLLHINPLSVCGCDHLQIIFRARRNHLLEKYTEEDNSPEKILEDVNTALEVRHTYNTLISSVFNIMLNMIFIFFYF